VARGAVIRLLQDKISVSTTLTLPQREFLSRMPEVTTRKSRRSYGIEVEKAVESLDDFDARVDETFTDPEGIVRTLRMDWYIRKGDELGKLSPVMMQYHQHLNSAPRSKCQFTIRWSGADEPPSKADPNTVFDLCHIETDWGTPWEDWKPVGEPSKGYRRIDGLAVGMRFEGVMKWTAHSGTKQKEHAISVDYAE
jgi:hypothetical protein